MKKIMFDDRYGLTKAVLEGRKTMTRRIVKEMAGREYKKLPQIVEDCNDGSFLVFKDADDFEPIILYPKYNHAEVVAVAQSYKGAGFDGEDEADSWAAKSEFPGKWNTLPGFTNKMFVRADLMPHQIRITNVRVERLQDISDEDCRKEGIDYVGGYSESYYFGHGVGNIRLGNSYRDAFAALIDKVFGKGTWEANPWVFVYEFELVK